VNNTKTIPSKCYSILIHFSRTFLFCKLSF